VHYIQKHIIDLLRTHDALRYVELQPPEIESSHFKYHLNQLIKDGYVAQLSRGIYQLSDAGAAHADRLSMGRTNPFVTPKVITHTVIAHDNIYYLYKKPKSPFKGLYGPVSGKVHLGESTSDAATRELHEKLHTDIRISTSPKILDVRVYKSKLLLTHYVSYIFSTALASAPDNPLLTPHTRQNIENSPGVYLPEMRHILNLAESAQHTASVEIHL
jgi:ADP-ribose pyrophosphatase YjhB (NUDIX family)